MSSRFQAIIGAVCLLFCVLAISVGEVDAQTPTTVRPLSYTRVALPNGLVVLFNEDHSSPTIAAHLTYHIGSKHEGTGTVGFAHLCEHMMFEGSANVPPGQFLATMRAVGATSQRGAETWEDRTIYYQTIPSNQLETWLWLESDRMNMPFSGMDTTRLANVRTTIKSERQQARENVSFGFANNATLLALYGTTNPIRDPLASMVDIDTASFTGMRRFCAPYYTPNNAVIAISGDFQTAKARALVEKYFGSIKRGPAPQHPQIRPEPLTGDRRLVLEDVRARAPRLRMSWAGVGFAHPDRSALVALAEAVLGDRNSGLTKALTVDRQLATSIQAFHADLEDGGIFQVEVIARDSTPLATIEAVVDSVIQVYRTTPSSERLLGHYKTANQLSAITTLQSRHMRADTLSLGEVFAKDPAAYAKQVNAANRLTPADLQRVATKYIGSGRMVMSMVPAGKLNLVSKPDAKYETVKIIP